MDILTQSTLKDVMPYEFMGGEFDDTRAYQMKDVKVICEHRHNPWIGIHKNVFFWWSLENGYAVAFNENPSRGWSFPVKKLPLDKTL